MPLHSQISAGGWVVDRIDTESQTGVAKIFINMPRGLNAADRTRACGVMKNFVRIDNVSVRRGQLVIRILVSAAHKADVNNDAVGQATKIVNKLSAEIKAKRAKTGPRTLEYTNSPAAKR